jgi:uncharacterized protein with HXXEE motif
VTFRRAAWLLPAAFALHIADEAPGFVVWARRHASERYTARDFWRNNVVGMAMTLAGTGLVTRTRDPRAVYPYYAAVLTQQALFNPAFHAGTTVAFGEYSPGSATSPLFLAVWALATRAALREELVSRRGVAASIAAGAAIHAWVVADQVFFAFDGHGSDEAGDG